MVESNQNIDLHGEGVSSQILPAERAGGMRISQPRRPPGAKLQDSEHETGPIPRDETAITPEETKMRVNEVKNQEMINLDQNIVSTSKKIQKEESKAISSTYYPPPKDIQKNSPNKMIQPRGFHSVVRMPKGGNKE